MEIRQGYSYHIKDEFFDLVQDKYLMSNKEQLWKKSWDSLICLYIVSYKRSFLFYLKVWR